MFYVSRTTCMPKKKELSANEKRKRDVMDVEIEYDLPKRLSLIFYWNIYPKKNSKRAFRGIVLPSENYMKRHKIMSSKLEWRSWRYNSFPCRMTIISTARSKMKGDIDNQATSIMDLLVDVGLLPDDNKFIIQELEIRNVWYVKNAPLCRVELEPVEHPAWDINHDHKDEDLHKYKHYVDPFISIQK